MLDGYREIYASEANRITGWRDMDKNELCNKYLDEKSAVLKNAYLSAIIYKYWGHIQKFYFISKSIATEEDVYEWLIESILYALQHASWRRPGSSIYNDANGPDKVINRCLKCRRLTFYQAHNRMKRKDAFGMLSLDEIQENYNENTDAIMDTTTTDPAEEITINKLIKNCFMSKKYLTAFIIDNIAYGNTFKLIKETKEEQRQEKLEAELMAEEDEKNADKPVEETENKITTTESYYMFNQLWLEKRLKKLSIEDAPYFAQRYQIPVEDVKDKLIRYCMETPAKEMKKIIKNTLNDLRRNIQENKTLNADRFYEFR